MTSDDIIDSVKRRASIPESQVTFVDADFLDIANEEMTIGLVPSILMVHEEYLVYSEDVALVANKTSYPIPYRAIGNRLRDIVYVDSSDNEYPMVRVNPEDALDNTQYPSNSGVRRFKIQGGNIILLNTQSSSLTGSLRFRYYLRPNSLVEMSRGAEIQSIDTDAGVITFTDDCPAHFTTSILFDFNRTKADHRIISFDITATAVATNSITVDPDDLPDDLEVGDYVCKAGETVIPNIPTDLHVVLAHRVATRCLESFGDTEGLQNANAKLQEMEQKTSIVIDNRSESTPQKVINRNSLIKGNIFRGRR